MKGKRLIFIFAIFFSAFNIFAQAQGDWKLYYPHVASDNNWETEICVVNTGDQVLSGTFEAYDGDGNAIRERVLTLNGNNRRAFITGDEFLNSQDIRYVIFSADSSNMCGYTKFFQEGRLREAVPAVQVVSAKDILIPHIASDDMWGTGIALVNTTDTDKNLDIIFSTGQTMQISMSAGEYKRFTIRSLFGGTPQPDIKSAVIREGSGIIGLELFSRGNLLGGTLLTDVMANTLYFPHIASNASWYTGIAAINANGLSTNLEITPYTDIGIPLDQLYMEIPSGEKYIGTVKNLNLPEGTAWLKINSTLPINGFELFGTTDEKMLAGYSVCNINRREGVFPKMDQMGATGLAFVNTTGDTANVILAVYDDDGFNVAETSFRLAGYQKIVGQPKNFFGDLFVSAGTYLKFRSDKDLVGFQLNSSSDATMLDAIPALGPEYREITVLTYNTHLFDDTVVDWFADENYYEDTMRRHRIDAKIADSGADIVALQEVWAERWQKWFTQGSEDDQGMRSAAYEAYPYRRYYYGACLTAGPVATLGSGVVLLSKFPIEESGFTPFPVFAYYPIYEACDSDYFARKGVLTATVAVGDKKIRIGASHALTSGDHEKGGMAIRYVAITPFELNGEPYIFGLHEDVGANIFRINDYGTSSGEAGFFYGAGKELIAYGLDMSPNYKHVVSFQLNGHPYILGLHNVGANIWRINDEPATGFTLVKYGASMSYNYVHLVSFELNGYPYILGLHKDLGANIWRINDDPSTGITLVKYRADMSPNYVHLVPFEHNGHPYILGLHKDVGANIWRINDDPGTGITLVEYGAEMSPNYTQLQSFELNGRPYIFGLHKDVGANIWKVNDDPSAGLTLVKYGQTWDSDYKFIRSFQLSGHPYLFSLKNCCSQYSNLCGESRPGEAYISRINDDPSQGVEDVSQQEKIKIIADETIVKGGPPAIMMGDYNVGTSHYGIMDAIFEQSGAFDAYKKIHGAHLDGGETVDLHNNRLMQVTNPGKDPSDPNVYLRENNYDRIDYVYVKEAGDGWELVPVGAHVIRDWKYDDGKEPNMDLSDHYPVMVKLQMR